MNYLALTQQVAMESGVIPNAGPAGSSTAQPNSLVGATGQLIKFASFVNSSWHAMQLSRADWRFMRRAFTGSVFGGQSEFSASDMGLTRHARFITRPSGYPYKQMFTIYKTSEGVADESYLDFVEWEDYWSRFARGPQQDPGKPVIVTVDDQGRLVFYPQPDAAYTVRGMHFRTPQALVNDTDIPEAPEAYHMAIVYDALIRSINYDSEYTQFQYWKGQYDLYFGMLVADQTEPYYQAGALA